MSITQCSIVHVSYKSILVRTSPFAFMRVYSLSLKSGHYQFKVWSLGWDEQNADSSALRMIKHIPIILYLCQSAVCNYSLLHQRCKNHGMTKMLKNRTMYEKWWHNQDDGETKLWQNKTIYEKLFVTKDFWPVQAVLTSAIPIDSKKSGNPRKVVAKTHHYCWQEWHHRPLTLWLCWFNNTFLHQNHFHLNKHLG